MKAFGLMLLLLVTSLAVAEDYPAGHFPFGVRDGMTLDEFMVVARLQGAEPVSNMAEGWHSSYTVHPSNLSLDGRRVTSYRTMFVYERLWGLIVELEGTKDLSEHRRMLKDLVTFVDRTFPGETTSNRLDDFNAKTVKRELYVYEMKYKGVLFTIISTRQNDGTYTACVTFNDLNPARLKFK